MRYTKLLSYNFLIILIQNFKNNFLCFNIDGQIWPLHSSCTENIQCWSLQYGSCVPSHSLIHLLGAAIWYCWHELLLAFVSGKKNIFFRNHWLGLYRDVKLRCKLLFFLANSSPCWGFHSQKLLSTKFYVILRCMT